MKFVYNGSLKGESIKRGELATVAAVAGQHDELRSVRWSGPAHRELRGHCICAALHFLFRAGTSSWNIEYVDAPTAEVLRVSTAHFECARSLHWRTARVGGSTTV